MISNFGIIFYQTRLAENLDTPLVAFLKENNILGGDCYFYASYSWFEDKWFETTHMILTLFRSDADTTEKHFSNLMKEFFKLYNGFFVAHLPTQIFRPQLFINQKAIEQSAEWNQIFTNLQVFLGVASFESTTIFLEKLQVFWALEGKTCKQYFAPEKESEEGKALKREAAEKPRHTYFLRPRKTQ